MGLREGFLKDRHLSMCNSKEISTHLKEAKRDSEMGSDVSKVTPLTEMVKLKITPNFLLSKPGLIP